MRDRISDFLDQWAEQRPDLDASPMGVVGRVSRAARLLERRIAPVMTSAGLEPGEFDLLASLRRAGKPYRLTPGALVAASMVTSGAITARLDHLVAKGFVHRETDPDNRRQVLVTLTREGLRLVDKVVEAHLANETALLSCLGDGEQKQLARLLAKLLIGMGDTSDER